MSLLDVVELLVAAAIVVYVVLDSPERWNPPRPAEPPWLAPLPDPWKPEALVCVAPDGEEIEMPLAAGWDADSILATFAQIEAL